MKIAVVLGIVSILAAAPLSIAHAQGSPADVQKAIAALEEQWTEAERTNKPEQTAPLLADKFMVTDSEGKISDRAHFLEDEKASTYTSSQMSPVKVDVFGETAIARYTLHQTYTKQGKAFDFRFQETDTWVKMPGGTWQCVAGHSSIIKQK